MSDRMKKMISLIVFSFVSLSFSGNVCAFSVTPNTIPPHIPGNIRLVQPEPSASPMPDVTSVTPAGTAPAGEVIKAAKPAKKTKPSKKKSKHIKKSKHTKKAKKSPQQAVPLSKNTK